jgi:hypothetical protein
VYSIPTEDMDMSGDILCLCSDQVEAEWRVDLPSKKSSQISVNIIQKSIKQEVLGFAFRAIQEDE